MRKTAIIASITAAVALAVVAIAIAATSGGDDGPNADPAAGSCPAQDVPGISQEERERCFDTDSGDSGSAGGGSGGLASGSCPAEDVPGISQEERERCFGLDSPGGDTTSGGPTQSPEAPVSATPGGAAEPGASKLPGLPDDRRAEEAPIDGLDVRVAESFPPQYFIDIQAGLPSGCAEQYGVEVGRDGDVITIRVLNSMPSDPTTICTMIYGMYETSINLGSDFESGKTYTVKVNDEETTFTAQ